MQWQICFIFAWFYFDFVNSLIAKCPELEPCKCDNKGANGLNRIYCHDVNLSKIPDNFQGVRDLDIEDNQLNRLFKIPYPTLEFLTLNHNDISLLADNAFALLDKLRGLSLETNSISQLKVNHVANLKSLVDLNLKKNPLYRLVSGLFTAHTTIALKRLDLSHCNLQVLADDSIQNLPNLTKLDMSFNRINLFPILIDLSSLEYLNLAHNLIESIPHSTELKSLKYLNLSKNLIKMIGVKTLSNFISVVHLDLGYNLIQDIHKDALSSMGNLKEIDISHNNLTSIQSDLFLSPVLEKVSLHTNQWNCECDISWMISSQLLLSSKSLDKVRCSTPSKLSEKKILDIELESCKDSSSKTTIVISVIFGLIIGIAGAIFAFKKVMKKAQRSAYEHPVEDQDLGQVYVAVNTSTEHLFETDADIYIICQNLYSIEKDYKMLNIKQFLHSFGPKSGHYYIP